MPFLIPLQSLAFWALLVATTAAYSIKVLIFEYQSIDVHRIVLPVKFEGEVFVSVPRNKQLFKKNGGQKILIFKKFKLLIFKPRHLKKGQTLEKVHFLGLIFFVNRIDNSSSNLTHT
jgi:hypothetical protein